MESPSNLPDLPLMRNQLSGNFGVWLCHPQRFPRERFNLTVSNKEHNAFYNEFVEPIIRNKNTKTHELLERTTISSNLETANYRR